MTRICLRIDHVTADTPGLERRALEDALRAEIARHTASGSPQAFGQGRYRPVARAQLPSGNAPLAGRVAEATLKVLGK